MGKFVLVNPGSQPIVGWYSTQTYESYNCRPRQCICAFSNQHRLPQHGNKVNQCNNKDLTMRTKTVATCFLVLICVGWSKGAHIGVDLDNLGDQISKQVDESLKPVKILQSIFKVKFGEDGTTVATYKPGGRRLVIRDRVLNECDGSTSDADGSCSTPLKPFKFEKNEDFCYAMTKSIINNDLYCLGSTGSISVNTVNGQTTCKSTDGSKFLFIKGEEYKKLCQNVAQSVHYEYFTTKNLEHVGNGLECSGNNPQICTFDENLLNVATNVFGQPGSASTFVNNFKITYLVLCLLFPSLTYI